MSHPDCPSSLWYVPMAHIWQVVPPEPGWNFPGSQGLHVAEAVAPIA
jgi:hypothetical protein